MSTTVKFTATKLAPGKKGIITPDANGYYEMVIGGLNIFNSVGQYYTLDGAKKLFESSSVFMRRVANGCLKGEVGHPKKAPGMSMDDYMTRILTIEETNVCCHFKEIWLDETYGKKFPQFNNSGLVAIMAKIKPSGPKGEALKASFDNPDENVCFSIRSLTRDYYQKGQCYRVLEQIVGWDWVNEPGLANATQWSSPALEMQHEQIITKKNVESVLQVRAEMVSMEDTLALANESLAVFNHKTVKTPLFNKW